MYLTNDKFPFSVVHSEIDVGLTKHKADYNRLDKLIKFWSDKKALKSDVIPKRITNKIKLYKKQQKALINKHPQYFI